jgi:hypothetical protein
LDTPHGIQKLKRGIEGDLLCSKTTFFLEAILKPDNADLHPVCRQVLPTLILPFFFQPTSLSISSSIAKSNWVLCTSQVIVDSFRLVVDIVNPERMSNSLLLPSLNQIYRKNGTLTFSL